MASVNAYTGRKEMASLSLGWTISKLEEKMNTAKPGEHIDLLNVKVGDTNWKFRLCANGDIEDNKGNVSFYCYSLNETATLAEISITLKDGQLRGNASFTHSFTEQDNNWGFHELIPHTDINTNKNNYLKNGNLELVIKMTVYGDETTTIKTDDCQNLDSIKMIEKGDLCAAFKECWIDEEFSDVKIKCSETIFNCHRIILSKRSNYFSAMFKGNFKERLSEVIVMENMDAETFKAVLKYIYEGELESLETNAMELLEAAERFELFNLKKICEDFLIGNYMKLENVIDTLLVANLYKAQKLKQAAMDMIVANSDKVTKQEGWKEKLGRSSELILEIFEAIAAQK